MNFHASIEERASEIERYYQEGDLENYTIKVHALKSSARIIGAISLSKKAELLEAAGEAMDKEVIGRDTPPLLELYRSYKEELAPIKADEKELPEADDAIVQDAYSALGEFADAMDFALAQMVLDSMDEYRLKSEDRSRFDRLRSAVSRMDWEQVHTILTEG